MEINSAIIPITTSSSTKVNAFLRLLDCLFSRLFMGDLLVLSLHRNEMNRTGKLTARHGSIKHQDRYGNAELTVFLHRNFRY